MKKKNHIRQSTPDRVFSCFVFLFLAMSLLLVAYPLLYVFSASFSDPNAVVAGKVYIWPVRPTFVAYKTVLKYKSILTGFRNSVIYMFSGTALNIVFTVLSAYPLSRKDFWGKDIFSFFFAFTMYVGGGIVPTYILISNLKMLDTIWAMIVPGMINVWHIIMCRTFIQTSISGELFEAAEIDGCSDFGIMLRIVVPLSTPILAVLCLYTAVGLWNGYFSAMIYLSSQDKYPLQIALRSILMLGQITITDFDDVDAVAHAQALAALLKYAVIVVATLPMMLIYPFVQKFFVKGAMIGAVKG